MDLPEKNNLFSLLRILGLLGGILILVQAAFIAIVGIIVGTVSIGIVHVSYNGPIPFVIAIVLALVIIGLIIGVMVIMESNQIISSGTMRPFIVLLILGIISLFLDNVKVIWQKGGNPHGVKGPDKNNYHQNIYEGKISRTPFY